MSDRRGEEIGNMGSIYVVKNMLNLRCMALRVGGGSRGGRDPSPEKKQVKTR